MTLEQRMAELGVDLSDLNVVVDRGNALYEKYYESAKQIAEEKGLWFNGMLLATLLIHEICERDDIIDRMETRLVNVTGELNYIKDTFRDCATCTVGSNPHSDKCDACGKDFSNYEFAGVLENWRADDD